jgi:gas vesicle protein
MRKKNNWLLIVVVGALSAGVALLFAPKSGKELRRDIKQKGAEAKDSAKQSKDSLVADFKESYFEAEREVENELVVLDERQKELRETIDSIEADLQH